MLKLTKIDNFVIVFIAIISISLSTILGMSFPLEPAIGKVDVPECEKRATAYGFTKSICQNKEFASTTWGGSLQYFAMAVGEQTIAPLSLRPFVPLTLGVIAKFTLNGDQKKNKDQLFKRISLIKSLLNFLTGLSLILLPIFMFRNLFLKDSATTVLIILTGVINLGFVQTAPYFLLDLYAYFIFMCAAAAFFSKNILILSLIACVGVLVKEISIVLMLPIIALAIESTTKRLINFIYIFMPLFFFISLRLFMGEDPLSMQYSWKVSEGQIKLDYFMLHLGGINNFIFFSLKLIAGFGGILFMSIYFHRIYGQEKLFFITTTIIVTAVIVANIFLASRVPRIVGVASPFLLFYVLYILENRVISHNREK